MSFSQMGVSVIKVSHLPQKKSSEINITAKELSLLSLETKWMANWMYWTALHSMHALKDNNGLNALPF